MGLKHYLAAAAVLVMPIESHAEDFAIKFTGAQKQQFKPSRIAVASYSISFITAQKAIGSADLLIKSKVTTTLGGVDEATMRTLVNEAHSDLIAQLNAAGITTTSDAEVAKLIADSKTRLLPGNIDHGGGTGGLSIGTAAVKKGYVAVGADKAPLTDLYYTGDKTTGLAAIMKMGGGSKVNKYLKPLDATMIVPSLIIDFADSDAKATTSLTGMKRSIATTEAQFAIRMSAVNMEIPHPMGISWPGKLTMTKDAISKTPFSRTTGISTAVATGGNFTDPGTAEGGNVVAVDLPVWTALVQSAFRSYNAAIVREIVAAKAK